MLNICDPVLAFDELMEEVNIKRYLPERPYGKKGRPGYNRVNMLKTVLFGFMEHGYAALRTLDDDCIVNLRYIRIQSITLRLRISSPFRGRKSPMTKSLW